MSELDFSALLLGVLGFSGDEYVSICHKTNYLDTGVDLAALPAVMTSEELAPIVRTTVASLANDRYRGVGIPYVKMGHRVRYVRADVARYLIARRTDTLATARLTTPLNRPEPFEGKAAGDGIAT